jgi:predicted ABC-type transport system involved in lysophospholipase L1 biosynthesis ATPase subunit
MSSASPAVTAAASESLVRAVEVTKSYGTASSQVHALRGVSLQIAPGERVALLGKSGSGKSTLLHVLGGLDRPTSGAVWLAGQELTQMSAGLLARYRLKKVGMIFQAFNLISSRSALENVELPMIFAGRSPQERKRVAREALEAVGLQDRLNHRPSELSGGEQQRVAIARALINEPQLLLADEPTGNLDSDTAAAITDLLAGYLQSHRTTLLLVTHDEELARRCSDHVLRMKDGHLLP